jgi:2-polyprenyl-3-methyl-5-hydroxy-6-metoxy-1,4-benzoquinol methylase
MNEAEYFNKKWKEIINLLPNGGRYRFDLRQSAYDIIKNYVKKGSNIFDYACGLGIIDIQLEKENNCKVYGCDISEVAVDYINWQTKGKFKITNEFFKQKKKKYDYILAIYFIEHINNPVQWCERALEYGNEIIAVIPNDFHRHGEHSLMQWSNWDEFYALFSKYKIKRLDEGKYDEELVRAFKHPIFSIKDE